MIVDESRHDERAVQVDDARPLARELAHSLVGADDGNAVPGNADGIGERHVALASPDCRIHVRDVERSFRRDESTAGEQRAHAQQHFSSIGQSTSPGVGVPSMLGASSLA